MARRIGLPTVLLAALAPKRLALICVSTVLLAAMLFVPVSAGEIVVDPLGIHVEVEPEGGGTVVSDPGGFECSSLCDLEFEEGAAVTLTASPAPGYVFKSWKRCDRKELIGGIQYGVDGRRCTVTASEPKTVIAQFVKTQNLTVAKAEGSGLGKVYSSPGGILCLTNCTSATAAFLEGTVTKVKEKPARHFHFVEWLGNCTGSEPCELLMDEDREVEALFAEDPKQALTLTKTGDGRGVVRSKPAGIVCIYLCEAVEALFYDSETVVLEVPKVGRGSTFEGWYGGGCSGIGACTVAMTEAMEVAADFGPTFGGLFGENCPPNIPCVFATTEAMEVVTEP